VLCVLGLIDDFVLVALHQLVPVLSPHLPGGNVADVLVDCHVQKLLLLNLPNWLVAVRHHVHMVGGVLGEVGDVGGWGVALLKMELLGLWRVDLATVGLVVATLDPLAALQRSSP
jgi:hypothetical protein